MYKPQRNWTALTIAVLLLSYAIIVPVINHEAISAVDLSGVYHAPSVSHLFGTDQLGRDIWTRTAAGLRISMVMAVVAAIFSTILGALAAVAAVTFGRWVDPVITRLIDSLNAVPHLLLSVVILALWPGEIWAIILSIALTHWTQTARILRSKLLAERESGYVKLSVAAGAKPVALWRTHLLPAVLGQASIAFALQIPHAMWHESALTFLGVGLPAQSASLGLILEDARGGILTGAWWLLVFPATVLVLACWAVASLPVTQPRARKESRVTAPKVRREPSFQTSDDKHVLNDLQLKVTVAAGDTILVQSAKLRLTKGTINAVTGVSGAGKTLFLRAIAGLLPKTLSVDSSVILHGKQYPNAAAGKLLGKQMVFIPGSAATALNPVQTLRTALKRTFREHSLPSNDEQLATYWSEFGLVPELLSHYPHQLSGGQAQRAVLALGLAADPEHILLDEPTSALDEETRTIVANVLRSAAERGATVLMVTHDLELAENLAEHIYVMDNGHLMLKEYSARDDKVAP